MAMMAKERAFMPTVRGPSSLHRRNLFEWTGDHNGATEDDEYKPTLNFKNGYPIEYTCEKVLEEGVDQKDIWFIFEYDVTYALPWVGDNAPQVPDDVRRHFEWSLLWNVGLEIGLYNCSLDAQGSQPPSGNLRALAEQESAFQVVALGSEEEDTPEEGTICFSQNPSCVPMKGIMNAKYVGNPKDAEEFLLNKIEQVLATEFVHVEGVGDVLYVGDRETFVYTGETYQPPSVDASTGATSEPKDSSPGLDSFGLGFGIAIATALVISALVGFFVIRAVRKRRADKESEETRMSITSIEILDSIAIAEATDDTMETPTETPQPVEEVKAPAESNDTKQVSTDLIAETGIVPAAPTSRNLPASNKRRRRRKKKKKRKKNVMGLTRSSSIKSMDTITEQDEECESDDDSGSEYGSEYSTDDEDMDGCKLKRSTSTGSLSSEPWDPLEPWNPGNPQMLEEIVESPKIRKLPPPPV